MTSFGMRDSQLSLKDVKSPPRASNRSMYCQKVTSAPGAPNHFPDHGGVLQRRDSPRALDDEQALVDVVEDHAHVAVARVQGERARLHELVESLGLSGPRIADLVDQ